VAFCYYNFYQHIDYRGRPRGKVRKGAIRVELYATDDVGDLVAWSLSAWKALSGKVVFLKPNGEATLKHLWFTHAYCTSHNTDFNSTGTTGGASLRVNFTISPEDMGVEAGNGEAWIPPATRAYAYTPLAPIATPTPPSVRVAALVDPADIPPHLPAPQPQPSPDHQQIHLSQQERKDLIKDRWDSSRKAKNKKFFKQYWQAEFHVDGDPFTCRTDKKGKLIAVYDAQKSYNVTGTKNGLKSIPLTLNGQLIYAGTKHMYPVTGIKRTLS
jgi:hypothetical protein